MLPTLLAQDIGFDFINAALGEPHFVTQQVVAQLVSHLLGHLMPMAVRGTEKTDYRHCVTHTDEVPSVLFPIPDPTPARIYGLFFHQATLSYTFRKSTPGPLTHDRLWYRCPMNEIRYSLLDPSTHILTDQ